MMYKMYRMLASYSCQRYFKLSSINQHYVCPSVFVDSTFSPLSNISIRCTLYHTSKILRKQKNSDASEGALVPQDFFENVKNKNKETYLDMVRIFESKGAHRRGHVEFIYAALRHMEEFGVNKDLQAYKALIDVLPKGRFIPTNIFQAEFMHYPKQQQCIIDVLEQMENNAVVPDFELEDILVNIFGRRGHPVRKYWRMMYWMPKFKNISPWPLPKPVPNDSLELAKLAVKRMSSVDLQSNVVVYQTAELADSLDDTWIVSAQSPVQKELLQNHPRNQPVNVEGAFRIWLRDAAVNYFILRAEPQPRPQPPLVNKDDVSGLKVPLQDEPSSDVIVPPSVHEQEDGTILALCATGTSSRDSLLSWVRHLEMDGNSALAEIPVLFTLRSPLGEVIPLEDGDQPSSQQTKTLS